MGESNYRIDEEAEPEIVVDFSGSGKRIEMPLSEIIYHSEFKNKDYQQVEEELKEEYAISADALSEAYDYIYSNAEVYSKLRDVLIKKHAKSPIKIFETVLEREELPYDLKLKTVDESKAVAVPEENPVSAIAAKENEDRLKLGYFSEDLSYSISIEDDELQAAYIRSAIGIMMDDLLKENELEG